MEGFQGGLNSPRHKVRTPPNFFRFRIRQIFIRAYPIFSKTTWFKTQKGGRGGFENRLEP